MYVVRLLDESLIYVATSQVENRALNASQASRLNSLVWVNVSLALAPRMELGTIIGVV